MGLVYFTEGVLIWTKREGDEGWMVMWKEMRRMKKKKVREVRGGRDLDGATKGFSYAFQRLLTWGDDANVVIPNTFTPDKNDADKLKVQIKELNVALVYEKDISERKVLKKMEELTEEVKELGREVKVKYVEGKNEVEEEEQKDLEKEEEKDEE
ncbi:hypothetical protein DVH24_015487 [Malus domestica]|uniref:Uncharacterized protein n=1 Tax=Malus domestica TaxID=3750 RepID=A0A498HMU0_MALDO|nr:hypothetical protein DVH24_015487 [Malus domestica]